MYRFPHRDSNRRCSGQSTVAPPGTYREPITASAPASIRRSSSGSTRGIVGEVDVHRHDDVVALVEGDGEALAVGAAETLLARPAQQLDLTVVGRHLLDQGGGAVRAVVVDDEDVGVGDGRAHGPQERGHVLPLVVRRQDDDRARHRRAG